MTGHSTTNVEGQQSERIDVIMNLVAGLYNNGQPSMPMNSIS